MENTGGRVATAGGGAPLMRAVKFASDRDQDNRTFPAPLQPAPALLLSGARPRLWRAKELGWVRHNLDALDGGAAQRRLQVRSDHAVTVTTAVDRPPLSN